MDRGSSIKHGRVHTLPVFARGLKDIKCCDGDSVVLECVVKAIPEPNIRWEKDRKTLPLSGDFKTEYSGETVKLYISKVYPEDEGEYTCIAYNEAGKASTSARLIVNVPVERDAVLQKQLECPQGLQVGLTTPRSTPSRSVSPVPPNMKARDKSPSTLGTYSRLKGTRKAQAPKFYAVPHNKVAEEGETVRFQCAVAGHPSPWSSWDKESSPINPTQRISIIEKDDLRILEIADVTVDDAGLYRVRVENDFGSIDHTARLEIISNRGSNGKSIRLNNPNPSRASPTFGRKLSGSAATTDSKFTFACDVQASPSPVTSWYKNGEIISPSERIVPSWDGKTARLELNRLKEEDSGVYQCIAENELGKTRCSAELVVVNSQDSNDTDLKPPVFVSGLPPSICAAEGQSHELSVKLEGSEPIEVIWLKNGEEIPDCEDFRYKVYDDGKYGLHFADVFSADSGFYSCTAYNSHGDAISSGKLLVRDESSEFAPNDPKIQFIKSPNPVVAIAGGIATFCAKIKYSERSLRPNLNWFVAGQDTSRNPQKFKVEDVGDTSVLHIAGVDTNDAGVVKCFAKLGDDSCESFTELKVEQLEKYETPAILTQGPADIAVLRGEKVVLTAAFVGRPDPYVRWLKAGHELSSDGHIEIVTKDGVSSLTISGINTDDSGKYVVSVENIHGADCHFASVAVEGSPDPPSKKPSVLANERSVLITWSSPPFDGGCMITGYSIEMKTVAQRDWQLVTDKCHSLSYTVRELVPGETYVFRVRAENIHGLSEPSMESQTVQIKQTEDDIVSIYGTDIVKVENGEGFKDRFEILEELGKGRFGIVHKVIDKTTNCKLAAKFVKCIKAKDKEKVWDEINIMNCLRHPKLLQLIAAFENSREVIMILEYISGGELFERVVADDFTLTERDCILFMRQICEGVDFMHQNSVVHLDLKPENIMCRTRTSHEIKLIDFGLARKIDPNVDERHLFGTPEFIPPEIINYEPIGVESDMWSVGVICYVLLSGLSPFMGDNDAETFANITRADFDFDDEAFDAISQDAKDFISALLVKRKEKRLTAKQCLDHKWMTQMDTAMSCVALSTDKLKKFIIRRKWQKTGNAIRALGRMANLSAASRRNSNSTASFSSPRSSLSGSGVSRMSSLSEEADLESKFSSDSFDLRSNRMRICSERSDSGISDCSSISVPFSHSSKPLFSKDYSITEEDEGVNDKKNSTKQSKPRSNIKENKSNSNNNGISNAKSSTNNNRIGFMRQGSVTNNSFILKDKDLANGVVSSRNSKNKTKDAASSSDDNNNPSLPVSSFAVNSSKVRSTDRLKKMYESQQSSESKTSPSAAAVKRNNSTSTNPSFQKVVAFWKR